MNASHSQPQQTLKANGSTVKRFLVWFIVLGLGVLAGSGATVHIQTIITEVYDEEFTNRFTRYRNKTKLIDTSLPHENSTGQIDSQIPKRKPPIGILHIGPRKTGTTAIQDLAKHYKSVLETMAGNT